MSQQSAGRTAEPIPLIEVDDPAQVVDDVGDLTPGWLSAALSVSAGVRVDVREVHPTPIGTGQTGVSYRLDLEHDQAATVPATLVVKLAAGPPESRALVGQGYAWEVGFYQHVAHRVKVRTPRAWHAAISPDHTRFTLLLDDLTPAVPGRQADGVTPARARAALENLAALHAPLWNDPLLQGGLAWLLPLDTDFIAMLAALSKEATATFLDRYRDALTPQDAETLAAASELTEHWAHHHQDPFTVIHGDYRLDNLMFHPDHPGADGVAALDWQTLAVGHPLRDVAYFLSLSLPAPVRRAHEDDLLAGYHAALLAHGVTGYSLADCHEGYRVGMLHGPLITVLGCVYSPSTADAAADAMFVSMATRAAQAIRDQGSLEAAAR